MIMTRIEDEESVLGYIKATEAPIFLKTNCQNAHDFGGQDSIGLHVKRLGTSISDDCDDAFGRYLGEHPGGFAVLVTHIDYTPKAVELFETVEEMKRKWQLD